MPSSLAAGPAVRTRLKSRLVSGLIGYGSPEFPVEIKKQVAPGATGEFHFVAPRACKLVRIDQVNAIAGAGASKVNLRKHVAGQTAAPNAAVSGANIVELTAAGLPADTAANTPVLNTAVVTTGGASTFAAGDKLAAVYPATWAGLITCYFVWL